MKQYTKKTIPLSDILVNPKNPRLFTSGILCILLITTGIAFADSSLSITTDDSIYKIGDTISINLTNNADEPTIFNYKMLNSNDDNFAQKCVTDNNTSGVILPGDTQLILVHTSCAGMNSIGDWVVSSNLTHDGKLVDLFTSTKFSIVVELPQTQTQIHSEKYLNSTYPKRENIPSHIQNNTGWNRAVFDDYFLYPLVDKFGIVIFPILTKEDFSIEFTTKETTYLKSAHAYGSTYSFIFNDFLPDFDYTKVVNSGSVYYISESEKNNDDVLFAFPRVFDLDKIDVYPPRLALTIDDTHTHFSVLKNRTFDDVHISSHKDFPHDFWYGGLLRNLDAVDYDHVFSPLKQTQNGVISQEIICKENLELILHSNGSPACVKPESIPRLVEQGWIKVN